LLPFLLLAILVFLLTAFLHLCTLFGVDVKNHFSPEWLFIALPILFIPAIILQKQTTPHASPTLKESAPHAPAWMRRLFPALFLYSLLMSALTAYQIPKGSPDQLPDGTYQLSSHGHVYQKITTAEFHSYRILDARGTTSWMLIFFYYPVLILTSVYRERRSIMRSRVDLLS
jgi:hypothetical protein